MATLRQAEAARDQFADSLAQLGAHGVGVEEDGSGRWEVVVFVQPDRPFDAPRTLAAVMGQKTVSVPVKIVREGMFRPE